MIASGPSFRVLICSPLASSKSVAPIDIPIYRNINQIIDGSGI